MKLALGLTLLLPKTFMFTQNNIQNLEMPTTCAKDFECELPYRCCKGMLFNYCCTDGGRGARRPKSRFPNITLPKFPDDFPLPIPRPYPTPVPIPIPIPIPVELDYIV